MLSRRWPRPKWIKTRHCAGRPRASIRLKCNFLFTIKKILLSHPINSFPLQSFLESIRPKRNCKMVIDFQKRLSASRFLGSRLSRVAFGQRTKNQIPYQSNSHPNTTTDGLKLADPRHTPNRSRTTYTHSPPDPLSGGRRRPVSLLT